MGTAYTIRDDINRCTSLFLAEMSNRFDLIFQSGEDQSSWMCDLSEIDLLDMGIEFLKVASYYGLDSKDIIKLVQQRIL
jgi:hypothetical protein